MHLKDQPLGCLAPYARPWALAGERHYLLGSAMGCPKGGWVSEGDPVNLCWDPSALLQTGLVEAHHSWQGMGTKERGEKPGVLVGEVPPLPTASHMAVPPPLVCTSRPHLKLPLPASRAAEHLLPWEGPLAALWVPSQGLENISAYTAVSKSSCPGEHDSSPCLSFGKTGLSTASLVTKTVLLSTMALGVTTAWLEGTSVFHHSLGPGFATAGLQPSRLLSPWDFSGKNPGVGCHALPQGIFLTQGLNLGLLHCRRVLYHLSH